MFRKFLVLLFFLLPSLIYAQLSGVQCYTIVAGKDVTTTGKVLAAHNEDDYGDLIVNLYRTPKGFFTKQYPQFVPDDSLFQHEPLSTIWFEVTNQSFGDALINENGVVIWSDACASREDTATGLLTFQLRRLVAEYARNAREGVKLLGDLVERFGYNSSGRTYCIADAGEAWLVAVVKGHHWVAQRVPDDKVAIIPNYYTIEQVDLNDTVNFLGSKDLISYAQARGWYNPARQGRFNFRQAYSRPLVLIADWNIPRHWGGVNLISKDSFALNQHIPFAFAPAHKLSYKDLEKVLSYHYENTELAPDTSRVVNPHLAQPARICNAGTKISLVAQLNSTQPDDPENIIFWAPFNPCLQPYVPISVTLENIPKVYQSHPLGQALEHHFDGDKNSFEANPKQAYSVFYEYNSKINKNYWKLIQQARENKQKIEDYTLKLFNKQNDKAKASRQILKYLYKTEKSLQ